uniref:hypothetical protein n=1 Tax=Limosilactobacillus pulli TaxID=2991833 RepID=UPI0024BBC3FB
SDLIIRGRLSLFQFNLEIYTKYFTLPQFDQNGKLYTKPVAEYREKIDRELIEHVSQASSSWHQWRQEQAKKRQELNRWLPYR